MKETRTYRRLTLALLTAVLLAGATWPLEAAEPSGEAAATQPPAAEVFARLKALDGSWRGAAGEAGEGMDAFLTFRVSAGGTVLMETMFPGSEHEMINMYHLDGDDLVLTHYCSGGNQPTMRLAGVSDDGRTLSFAFTGGTNLDPAVDAHIHETSMTLLDANTLEERWIGYADGKPEEPMEMTLHRVE